VSISSTSTRRIASTGRVVPPPPPCRPSRPRQMWRLRRGVGRSRRLLLTIATGLAFPLPAARVTSSLRTDATAGLGPLAVLLPLMLPGSAALIGDSSQPHVVHHSAGLNFSNVGLHSSRPAANSRTTPPELYWARRTRSPVRSRRARCAAPAAAVSTHGSRRWGALGSDDPCPEIVADDSWTDGLPGSGPIGLDVMSRSNWGRRRSRLVGSLG
jgi:hypothetical protein